MNKEVIRNIGFFKGIENNIHLNIKKDKHLENYEHIVNKGFAKKIISKSMYETYIETKNLLNEQKLDFIMKDIVRIVDYWFEFHMNHLSNLLIGADKAKRNSLRKKIDKMLKIKKDVLKDIREDVKKKIEAESVI